MKTVAKFVTDPRLKQKLRDTTGIGTEATRANIINGLIGRGYLVRKAAPSALRMRHSRSSTPCRRPSPTRHHGGVGAGARHDRGRPDDAGHLHREAVRGVGQLVQQYRGATLSLKLPPAPACPQCGAPMQQRSGQERRVLVCSRYPDCKGTLPIESPTAGAAHRASGAQPQGVLIPRFPPRAGHFTGGEANVPHRAGLQSARLLLQRCARPVCPADIGRRGEGHCSTNRAAAIPLIGVPCLGHEGLPDALPPREP